MLFFYFRAAALSFFHVFKMDHGFFGAIDSSWVSGCFDDIVDDIKHPCVGRVAGERVNKFDLVFLSCGEFSDFFPSFFRLIFGCAGTFDSGFVS